MQSYYFDWENSGRQAILFKDGDTEMFAIQGYWDCGDADESISMPVWQIGEVVTLKDAVEQGRFCSMDEAKQHKMCPFLSLKSAEKFVQ